MKCSWAVAFSFSVTASHLAMKASGVMVGGIVFQGFSG